MVEFISGILKKKKDTIWAGKSNEKENEKSHLPCTLKTRRKIRKDNKKSYLNKRFDLHLSNRMACSMDLIIFYD